MNMLTGEPLLEPTHLLENLGGHLGLRKADEAGDVDE
jgi:hypothetical protein